MKKETVINYFSDDRRHRILSTATLIMFIFLVVEKLMAGFTAVYSNGNVDFSFSLHITDLVCVFVYISMAVLIGINVRYKYLLIPDCVLLCIKMFACVSGFVTLASHRSQGLLPELSVIENTVENFLFVTFLVVFFIGKLFTKDKRSAEKIPFVCLVILAVSFAVTVVFEIVKVPVEIEMYNYPVFVIVFNFFKGVFNEAFLDLPYILLTLLVYYTPKKSH